MQASRAQVSQLIILQRDERRDNDGRARPQQPRQFVDRRFPRTGRQNGQHVAVGDQGFDRGQLPGAEPLEAQALAREPLNHASFHVFIIRAQGQRPVNRGLSTRGLPTSRFRANSCHGK